MGHCVIREMQQVASAITFGSRVNLIRYDEADEVAGTIVKLAGWGATTVLQFTQSIAQINYQRLTTS